MDLTRRRFLQFTAGGVAVAMAPAIVLRENIMAVSTREILSAGAAHRAEMADMIYSISPVDTRFMLNLGQRALDTDLGKIGMTTDEAMATVSDVQRETLRAMIEQAQRFGKGALRVIAEPRRAVPGVTSASTQARRDQLAGLRSYSGEYTLLAGHPERTALKLKRDA